MMTAMARLPCKSPISSPQQSHQHHQHQQLFMEQQQQQQEQQHSRKSNNSLSNVNRSYWDMQQTRNPPASSAYARSQHRDHTGIRLEIFT